ncbi:MAG: rane protein [Candidatus Saccharibacteria bacterium]|nr:rane protein [Candidatus Saccharibacteria bacterium]
MLRQFICYDKNVKTETTHTTIIIRIVLTTALVLLMPLLAMQFTDEVKWDLTDFATIGALLIGGGLIFEAVTTRVDAKYRAVIAIAVAAAVLLVWIEFAVGIFGTPFSGS